MSSRRELQNGRAHHSFRENGLTQTPVFETKGLTLTIAWLDESDWLRIGVGVSSNRLVHRRISGTLPSYKIPYVHRFIFWFRFPGSSVNCLRTKNVRGKHYFHPLTVDVATFMP